tara:strand:- start:49 stop:576 length:528 start_codon:yes stop_codon:yes gene_type:complete
MSEKHNKLYYEQGRNGYTMSDTWMEKVIEDKDNKWSGGEINPKMLLNKEDLMKHDPLFDKELKEKVKEHYTGVKNHHRIEREGFELKEEENDFGLKLLGITREITELLIKKNKAYGNTALNPSNIFSKLSSTEAICARLDDKLARIKNKGINDKTEDTVDDLIGYLLLLKMSMKS